MMKSLQERHDEVVNLLEQAGLEVHFTFPSLNDLKLKNVDPERDFTIGVEPASPFPGLNWIHFCAFYNHRSELGALYRDLTKARKKVFDRYAEDRRHELLSKSAGMSKEDLRQIERASSVDLVQYWSDPLWFTDKEWLGSITMEAYIDKEIRFFREVMKRDGYRRVHKKRSRFYLTYGKKNAPRVEMRLDTDPVFID